MYNLALMYQDGRGGARNYTEAANWFRQAADHNYDAAKVNLASLYQNGWGVPRDLNTALDLYGQAARSRSQDVAQAARPLYIKLKNEMAAAQRQAANNSVTSGGGVGSFGALFMAAVAGFALASHTSSNSAFESATSQQQQEKGHQSWCFAAAWGGSKEMRDVGHCPY
jgi:hypothetical protein